MKPTTLTAGEHDHQEEPRAVPLGQRCVRRTIGRFPNTRVRTRETALHTATPAGTTTAGRPLDSGLLEEEQDHNDGPDQAQGHDARSEQRPDQPQRADTRRPGLPGPGSRPCYAHRTVVVDSAAKATR